MFSGGHAVSIWPLINPHSGMALINGTVLASPTCSARCSTRPPINLPSLSLLSFLPSLLHTFSLTHFRHPHFLFLVFFHIFLFSCFKTVHPPPVLPPSLAPSISIVLIHLAFMRAISAFWIWLVKGGEGGRGCKPKNSEGLLVEGFSIFVLFFFFCFFDSFILQGQLLLSAVLRRVWTHCVFHWLLGHGHD